VYEKFTKEIEILKKMENLGNEKLNKSNLKLSKKHHQ
jgi:hypothetical protein